MKKLITLCLALAGLVGTANADEYIVSGNSAIVNGENSYCYVDNGNVLTETSVSGVYTLVVEGCNLTAKDNNNNQIKYGFKVKVNENRWNDDTTFPSSPYEIYVPYDGTYTIVYYVDINNKKIQVIAQPMLRWNFGGEGNGNWTWLKDDASNFTKNGDFGWTFEVPSSKFTSDFSFRIYSAVFQKSAYPDAQDTPVSFASSASTSAYFNTAESTSYSWKLSKPSYSFEKVIISAVYNPFATNDGTWDVSADCFISKTVSDANEYATFGTTVPVDLSNLPSGVTAYTVTASASTGLVSKVAKSGILDAGKGVLLYNSTGDDVNLSIPVAATPEEPSSEANDMVAFTGERLYQPGETDPDNGCTYYILGKQNNHVGFYSVNVPDGNAMGTSTAYLKVTNSAARSYYWFDESTGISEMVRKANAANCYYNLNGQSVAQPTKGLYIVNGKKVIMK